MKRRWMGAGRHFTRIDVAQLTFAIGEDRSVVTGLQNIQCSQWPWNGAGGQRGNESRSRIQDLGSRVIFGAGVPPVRPDRTPPARSALHQRPRLSLEKPGTGCDERGSASSGRHRSLPNVPPALRSAVDQNAAIDAATWSGYRASDSRLLMRRIRTSGSASRQSMCQPRYWRDTSRKPWWRNWPNCSPRRCHPGCNQCSENQRASSTHTACGVQPAAMARR